MTLSELQDLLPLDEDLFMVLEGMAVPGADGDHIVLKGPFVRCSDGIECVALFSDGFLFGISIFPDSLIKIDLLDLLQ